MFKIFFGFFFPEERIYILYVRDISDGLEGNKLAPSSVTCLRNVKSVISYKQLIGFHLFNYIQTAD